MNNFKDKLKHAEQAANQQTIGDDQVIKFMIDGLIKRDVSCEGIKPDPDLVSGKKRMISLSEGGSIKFYAATKDDVRRWINEGWTFDDETTEWVNEKEST